MKEQWIVCQTVQDRVFALELDASAHAHIAECEACSELFAAQQSLDRSLARAYTAPELSPEFHKALNARIRSDKRKRNWDLLTPLVGPAAGLVTSGLCALAAPQIAGLLLSMGVGFSVLGYAANLLYMWLTEELGEA